MSLIAVIEDQRALIQLKGSLLAVCGQWRVFSLQNKCLSLIHVNFDRGGECLCAVNLLRPIKIWKSRRDSGLRRIKWSIILLQRG